MANKIQIKRGLQANLPTLDVGEPALTTNSGSEKIYIGTGSGNKEVSDLLVKYGTATGTNAYVVSIPRVTTLTTGLEVTVKFTNASTGTTTINVSGLGVKNIIKAGGGSPKIKAGGVYNLFYDGTSFQLLGEGGEYGTAQASDVLAPKTIGTDNGLVTGTMLTAINSSPYEQSSELYIGGGGVTYMKISSPKYYPAGTWLTFTEPNLIASNVRVGAILGSTTKITGTYTGLGNASTSQVLSGIKFSTSSLSNATGTMVNRGAVTNTITTQGGAYTIPVGYHSGAGKVTANFANLVAGNVKSGVNIGGVVGTFGNKIVGNTYSEIYYLGVGNSFRTVKNTMTKMAEFRVNATGTINLSSYISCNVNAQTTGEVQIYINGTPVGAKGTFSGTDVNSTYFGAQYNINYGDLFQVYGRIISVVDGSRAITLGSFRLYGIPSDPLLVKTM